MLKVPREINGPRMVSYYAIRDTGYLKNDPRGPNIFSELWTWLKGLNTEMHYHS